MRFFIHIILPILAMCLLASLLDSCSEKAWKKRGFKKGWIDTAAVKDTFHIDKDTIYQDSIVEKFIDRLDSIYLKGDTIHHTEIRTKIKYILKTEFIPAVEKEFKDTTFTLPDGLKLKLKFTDKGLTGEIIYKKTEIKEPEHQPWYNRKFMSISPIGFLWLFIIMILVAYILFKK